MDMIGRVHVYTGDGKGKTTAALGLIVRACGAGLRVFLGQFIKGRDYSELKTLRDRFPDVTVEQFGRGCFIKTKPSAEDIRLAEAGLARLREALSNDAYDIVIADEANCAVKAGLFPVEELLSLIDKKREGVELIFTGRDAHARLIERADLVSEIKAVKHYYDNGVQCRPGIET